MIRFRSIPMLVLAAICLGACRKGEITTYRIPKETAAPAMASAQEPAGGHREVDWRVPAGWQEMPASGMRVGSFQAQGNVDISVIPLAGDAGGELANVNRWRGQLSLPPVDAAGLAKIARSARVGPHDVRLVEFAEGGKRLIAATIMAGGTSWFFKATGPDQAVKDARPAFLSFVESARFHNHE